MNSDDDPRAIDWPEKQVARLDKRIEVVEGELAGTDRAVDAHNLRISALENALTAYGIPFGSAQRGGLIGCFPPVEPEPEYSAPIGGVVHEDKIPQMGAPWSVEESGTWTDEIEAVFPKKRTDEGLDKYRAGRETVTGVQAMGREQYRRGLSAGGAKAIENAERRIRAALVEMGHPLEGHQVDQIIRALRGEPKHDTPVMADENEPEPCTCSACVGERTP
jgi:hypothetical protein